MAAMTHEMTGVTDEMPAGQNERSTAAALLLALIPVSVFFALLVLIAMAANAASATGGCGGG
jgi:hypothetical protein